MRRLLIEKREAEGEEFIKEVVGKSIEFSVPHIQTFD
jgi:hypothetical protein